MRIRQQHAAMSTMVGLVVAGLAGACSGDPADDEGPACGGAAATTSAADSGLGSAGAASTTTTSTASAPPPVWGPPSWTTCLPHGLVTTCAAYCASYSLSCSTACQSPYTGELVGAMTFNNTTCTSYFPGGATCDVDIYTSDSARCCCGI